MARTRAPCAPEFCRLMIELERSGRTLEQLVREFEPSAQPSRNWLRPADRAGGCRTEGTVQRLSTTESSPGNGRHAPPTAKRGDGGARYHARSPRSPAVPKPSRESDHRASHLDHPAARSDDSSLVYIAGHRPHS